MKTRCLIAVAFGMLLGVVTACEKQATAPEGPNPSDKPETAAHKVELPFQNLSFEAACKKAKAENKAVFLDFYTVWCGPCKQLDKTTFKDKKVQAWLAEKTIAIKVDAEKHKDIAKRYHVSAYPTLLFVKADGTEIGRNTGYASAERFLTQSAKHLGPATAEDDEPATAGEHPAADADNSEKPATDAGDTEEEPATAPDQNRER